MKMLQCHECGCELTTPSEKNVGYCEQCHAELDAADDFDFEEDDQE